MIACDSAVKRAWASAHGTGGCWAPCSTPRTRRASARTKVRYCIDFDVTRLKGQPHAMHVPRTLNAQQ